MAAALAGVLAAPGLGRLAARIGLARRPMLRLLLVIALVATVVLRWRGANSIPTALLTAAVPAAVALGLAWGASRASRLLAPPVRVRNRILPRWSRSLAAGTIPVVVTFGLVHDSPGGIGALAGRPTAQSVPLDDATWRIVVAGLLSVLLVFVLLHEPAGSTRAGRSAALRERRPGSPTPGPARAVGPLSSGAAYPHMITEWRQTPTGEPIPGSGGKTALAFLVACLDAEEYAAYLAQGGTTGLTPSTAANSAWVVGGGAAAAAALMAAAAALGWAPTREPSSFASDRCRALTARRNALVSRYERLAALAGQRQGTIALIAQARAHQAAASATGGTDWIGAVGATVNYAATTAGGAGAGYTAAVRTNRIAGSARGLAAAQTATGRAVGVTAVLASTASTARTITQSYATEAEALRAESERLARLVAQHWAGTVDRLERYREWLEKRLNPQVDRLRRERPSTGTSARWTCRGRREVRGRRTCRARRLLSRSARSGAVAGAGTVRIGAKWRGRGEPDLSRSAGQVAVTAEAEGPPTKQTPDPGHDPRRIRDRLLRAVKPAQPRVRRGR